MINHFQVLRIEISITFTKGLATNWEIDWARVITENMLLSLVTSIVLKVSKIAFFRSEEVI